MNPHTNKNPSLLEGLDIPEKSTGGKKYPARRDFADAAASSTVSRDWTPKQKKIAAIALACGAAVALALGGIAVVQMRPLELPKSFDEAKVAMETSKFKNMDEVRQAQYRTEAERLIREKMKTMTDEERRAFFRDETNREIMGQIREQQMDENARKIARGEKIEFGFGGPGGPGGFRGPGPNTPVNVASLTNFQPRPGDDPPSPAPRTNENRREWGPNGNQGGGPNQNNAPGARNQPGNNAPNQGGPQSAPGNAPPGPGGAPSGPAPAGSPGGQPGGGQPGGGQAGGGGPGGGRRGSPVARMANRIQKGNAQSNGLRFEMFKKMMQNAPPPGEQIPAFRVMFTSGSAELNEAAFASMTTVIKQLTDQPETSLRIWGLVDARSDGAKLRHTALRDSFAIKLFGTGAKGEQLTNEQLEQQMLIAYNDLLARKAAEANKPAPALVGPNSEVPAPALAVMEEALVEGAPAPTEHLVALAQQRQDAIKKYLVEKREFNAVRIRTVGVAPQFMETQQPSAVLQVAR